MTKDEKYTRGEWVMAIILIALAGAIVYFVGVRAMIQGNFWHTYDVIDVSICVSRSGGINNIAEVIDRNVFDFTEVQTKQYGVKYYLDTNVLGHCRAYADKDGAPIQLIEGLTESVR